MNISKEKLQPLKNGCCVLQRKGGDEWGRAGVCTIFAEPQTGSDVRKLPSKGAEQKWSIFSVNRFHGIGIAIQRILHSFVEFLRAKAPALLMLGSTRASFPPFWGSLFCIFRCSPPHHREANQQHKSNVFFSPLQITFKKPKHSLQHWDMEFSFPIALFLISFVCVCIGFCCCRCVCLFV